MTMADAFSAVMTNVDQARPWQEDLYRDFHQHPELSHEEHRTAAAVADRLGKSGFEVTTGVGGTGVVGIRHNGGGPTVLLRADMDALPVQEDTGLPYASTNDGVAHACGHDMHTACLLGAADLLATGEKHWKGTLVVVFQPAEETINGAQGMVDDGLAKLLPKVDVALGQHVVPLPAGTVSTISGPAMAAADSMRITVFGRGGHASMPQDALDPIPILCEIVTALQAMVTRRISVFDPAVITIARIEAGTTDNVIPEDGRLWGTLRTLSERTRATAQEGIRRVAEHVAAAHGARAEVEIEPGFPVTICDGRVSDLARRVSTALYGEGAWHTMASPMMGAEDFSYVLQKLPGAMAFIGAAPEGGDYRTCCALHSNRMTIQENVMARGIAMHCAMAEAMLSGDLEL